MDKSDIGSRGEEIAVTYLSQRGHVIICRNYRMKFGEIDIVSKKEGVIYFTEVKSSVRSNNSEYFENRPEERVNKGKLEKLSRVVEYYLLNECREVDPGWEFLVVAVSFDTVKKKAHVKLVSDILGS